MSTAATDDGRMAAATRGGPPAGHRPIPGLPADLYRAGDDGRVQRYHKGERRWKDLAIHFDRGMALVQVRVDGRRVKWSVGGLILRAFGQPRPLGCTCLHKDGNPANNALSNLAWAPRNTSKIGRESPNNPFARAVARCREEGRPWRGHNVKLTPEKIELARAFYASGATHGDIAEELGVSRGCVQHLFSGRTFRDLTPDVAGQDRTARGSFSSNATIDEETVREVLRLISRGKRLDEIARLVGASPSVVRGISRGTGWRHVSREGLVKPPRVGSRIAGAKLTEEDVACILSELASGARGRDLARRFGVTEAIISRIRSGKTWRHVPRPEAAHTKGD
jgi:hypothetical protein